MDTEEIKRLKEINSELLEALRRLLPSTPVSLRVESRHEQGCKCAIHEARAAIAKATGASI